MLKEKFVTLRCLERADKAALAKLANNRKVWNNLRDHIPHPYTVKDAAAFIQLNLTQDPPLIFAILYRRKFCGVMVWCRKQMCTAKRLKSVTGWASLSGTKELLLQRCG